MLGDKTTGFGFCLPTVSAPVCGAVELVRFPESVAVMTRS